MFTRLRNLASMLLGLVPTALTLALLAGIAWWGYVRDWKIPTLPELLNPTSAKKTDEAEKKEDKDQKSAENALPLIKLASKEKLEEAGIKTGLVKQEDLPEYALAHGHIDFDQNHYAHLSTRASGKTAKVFKQAGDKINKGDVLALIACPELASLKFELQQTLLTVQTRDAYYRRLQISGETTAKKDLESAAFAARDARVALSKTQQSLQNLGLHVPLDAFASMSDEQVTAKLRTLGIPDSLLQQLDPEATAGNNLLPMYAPFDSVVIKRDIVEGEMVTPATPQFHLANLTRLWVCIHVRLEDVGRLKGGEEVLFHLNGPDQDAPPARITWISAEVDEKTRTVNVRAEVANPEGRLRPGTFGDARIVVGRQKRLLVPSEALQFDGTSYVVFVRSESDTKFQPRRVKVGSRYNDLTVVESDGPFPLFTKFVRLLQTLHKDFTLIEDGSIKAGQTIAVAGTHALLSEMQRERIEGDD